MLLTDFQVLTFDCYGTLIDWETGLYKALQPLLRKGGVTLTRDDALAAFGQHEAAQEAETPKMIYSDLLSEVHRRLDQYWGVGLSEEEHTTFGRSVPDWPAFPDAVTNLQYLKQHYKLVILSNVDRASFASSNRKLGVRFDAVYTAQDIGSYKPDPANFEYMVKELGDLGVSKGHILHTAQSLFHDHVPANVVGLASAWIDRRHGAEGWGATSPPAQMPRYNFRFSSLGEMAQAHRASTSARD